MFDEKTRDAIRQNEAGFGNAFAGRGPELNAAFGSLRKLAESAQAPLATWSRPRPTSAASGGRWRPSTRRSRRSPRSTATLFIALDRTFAAFAQVSRPFIQETISKGPETLDTAIEDLPAIDPSCNPPSASSPPSSRAPKRSPTPRRSSTRPRSPASRCSRPRRCSTPSSSRPRTRCSPSRKRRESSTASTC